MKYKSSPFEQVLKGDDQFYALLGFDKIMHGFNIYFLI